TAFDTSWLGLIGSTLELHPWDYQHDIAGKAITVTAPLRWIISFRGNYAPPQVKNILAGKEAARPEYPRQFAVNALVLELVLARNPGLVRLFADLHYDLKMETPADLRGLPVVTVTSTLGSFRPADDLIAAATTFSGVPAFIELLDLRAIRASKDVRLE